MTAVTATTSSTMTRVQGKNRRIAVIVGILFFFQLITFLIGSSLIQAYLDGDARRATLTMGVLLEMCAGLAVVAIGILMYRVLKTVNKKLALGYPIMRILEFTCNPRHIPPEPTPRVPKPSTVGVHSHRCRWANIELPALHIKDGPAAHFSSRLHRIYLALARSTA